VLKASGYFNLYWVAMQGECAKSKVKNPLSGGRPEPVR